MRIAFFGLRSAFDYYQIGGTESLARRFALGLIQFGDQVDYVLFNASETKIIRPHPGLTLYYFRQFDSALQQLRDGYNHIISMYLPPAERLHYLQFRLINKGRIAFHIIQTSMSVFLPKRVFRWFDSKLFFEHVFVISPRLQKAAQAWGIKPILLSVPVPEEFFVEIDAKPKNEQLKVTYVGRIERDKGIEDVIELFRSLQKRQDVELLICGYHWPKDRESLRIHDLLRKQHHIRYIHAAHNSYSAKVEERLRLILYETDILLLPYKDLRTTIDMPMLLLEGMASLCAIITRPFANILYAYGEGPFFLRGPDEIAQIENLIGCAAEKLPQERQRIFEQNKRLGFRTKEIVRTFRANLVSRKGE